MHILAQATLHFWYLVYSITIFAKLREYIFLESLNLPYDIIKCIVSHLNTPQEFLDRLARNSHYYITNELIANPNLSLKTLLYSS